MINSVSLKLPCKQNNIDIILSTIKAFLSTSDLSEEYNIDITNDTIQSILTATSEGIQNCIDHAYKNHTGEMRISMNIYNNRNNIKSDTLKHEVDLSITIKDYGVGIENIEEAMEPFYTTKNKTNSGMGFTVMESFMDEVYVESNKGTEVKLIKHLN